MHLLYSSAGNLGKLLGPLPMHPAAEDNYGYDACAVLCLPCVPNILVIATESGMLYHCVVLDGEEDDEQVPCLALFFYAHFCFFSQSSWQQDGKVPGSEWQVPKLHCFIMR